MRRQYYLIVIIRSMTKPIATGKEYIDSLRKRDLNVYLLGEKVSDPVEHPIIRPSINAVAETYDLAQTNPDLVRNAGDIIYLNNIDAVSRSNTTTETVRLVISF